MNSINSWCLPSNSGRSNVSFEALALHDNEDIEFRVKLSGKAVRHDTVSGLADDVFIELSSVFISTSACRDLLDKFDSWMHNQEPFASVLVDAPGHGLDFQISLREDLITTLDKPAVTICHARNSCRLEVFFVIDQTCIEQSRTELRELLATFKNG